MEKPAKAYYIDFETDKPGGLQATKVSLATEVILDDQRPLRVDLCDHPLYAKLERYVLANPSVESPKAPEVE